MSIDLVIDILLYGCDKLIKYEKKKVFLHTINYIRFTKPFERSLIHQLTLGSLYIFLSLLF